MTTGGDDKASTSNNDKLSVGFIGCGMMATAVIDGLIAKHVVSSPKSIAVSDIDPDSLRRTESKGVQAFKSNTEVCKFAKDVLILAIKPTGMEALCDEIVKIPSKAVVISISAGIRLEQLEYHLPGRHVVRAMPNSPAVVGEAATGYTMGVLCTPQDHDIVHRIFDSVGLRALEIQEVLLNAVTGLSGSGPAYVFQFIEALSDGGVRSGLPRDVATQLAAQTVKGAAEMVLQTTQHPAQLRDNVESPGGTTIAGIEQLEKGGFRSSVIQAVTAATKRSMQLGDISEHDIRHVHNL